MKKIIVTLLFIAFTFQTTFAEYTLSSSEAVKIEKAITLINNFIDKNGESVRKKLIIKIEQILNRPNLSEKNITIFNMILTGISESEDFALGQIVESLIEEEVVVAGDFSFVFSDNANRCSSNPCETPENFVKIEGNVNNSQIQYVEVNDYRLNSYAGSNWEYNPNIAYNNFSDGENIYVINYLSSDSEILYTQEFIINKIVPEIVTNLTPDPSPLEEKGVILSDDIIEDEKPSSPVYSVNSDIPYVDEDEVREYWRGLLNEERTLLGLDDYTYDKSLDKTAKIWSDMALDRGYIDHKVDSPGDSYYDYAKKVEWMEDNGVVCENVSRATFSESIAWNNYYCSDTSTCTDQLKNAIKRTYDFYMSEKGTDYDPHYRAIAHVNFETMGLGLSVEELGNGGYKMYLTNHYCTTNIK